MPTTLQLEYVTSAVSLLRGDGIVVHVVNDSGAAENAHIVIYQNTGAGASQVADSGSVVVVPTWTSGFAFTVSDSGEYWVRIQATSEFLIPKASFERPQNSVWIPMVSYRPADFAIFTLQPHRKRLVPSAEQCVGTIADLRAVGAGVVTCVTVLGYHAPGDGGGGTFYWDASSSDTDDGGTVLQLTVGGVGRFKRLIAETSNDIDVRWFGAKGSGDAADATTNTTAIRKAITFAQAHSNATIVFGAGIYCYNDTITIGTANKGISIVGSLHAALQQGSARPVTTLRWTGGAKETFNISTSYVSFFGIAVENTGTATHFAKGSPGTGKLRFERVCCLSGATGPTTAAFSAAFLSVPNINYTLVDDCEFADAAPIIFDVDGMRVTGGTTTFFIRNCIIDSTGLDTTVVRLKDAAMELLGIYNNTFNKAGSKTLTVVDTMSVGTDTLGRPQYLYNLVFRDNEYDDSGSVACARMLKLLRTMNLDLENNNIEGGGSNTAIIELTDSVAYVGKNFAHSVYGPLVETMDTLSRVFFKPNGMNSNVTGGLINSSTTSAGIVKLAPNPSTTMIPIHGNYGDPGGETTYKFDAPDMQNYTIYYSEPTDSVSGYMTRGQKVTVMIRNTSGGAMGTITFNAPQFRTSGPFTSPANGKNRSISFVFDGAYMVEIFRTPLTGGSTFDDGDTTPSVGSEYTFYKTANTGATTVTTFDDGRTGQIITVIFGDSNTTLLDAGNLKLSGAFTSTLDAVMRLVFDGTNWYEISRSMN